MTQPITSKLAVIAQCMDEYTRLENNAHLANAISQARQIDRLLEERSNLITNINNALSRINDLEEDLRATFDHNERLMEQIYNLEVSILDCPTHRFRFATPTERDVFFNPEPVLRAAEFEVVDLTTDSEVSESE